MIHRVHLVVGARPNFMKAAPLYRELRRHPWCSPALVHTGQHYDYTLSQSFFEDLGMPAPDHALNVGSASHAVQTAAIMAGYDRVLRDDRPACTVVIGDVNSTVACALTAAKERVPVAHLEAGLRSFDRSMPEELNRIVTDALADILWTPSPDADDNLAREGVPAVRVERVGNIMMDCFEMLRERILADDGAVRLGLSPGGFAVVTLHRPANVDAPAILAALVDALRDLGQRLPVVFPVHPRTRDRLERFGLWPALAGAPGLLLHEPLGYMAFMGLVTRAGLVVTDSGGLQEETTYLGIPCLTVRENTERPITISQGTNRLCRAGDIPALAEALLSGGASRGRRPDLWDGRTAGRVAQSLKRRLDARDA
jgi:UDP-N-acetylglucosamine 2-epimerase (non-hydrolysing)